jgi:hypothetical protein
VIGGIIVYKQFVAYLEESSSEEEFLARRTQAYSRFVVKFLIIEFILLPIILYGVYQTVSGMVESADVTLPLMIVLLIILFGVLSLYFTSSQIIRDPNASDRMKNWMSSMMIIWFGLINSFPVVSLGLLLVVMLDL